MPDDSSPTAATTRSSFKFDAKRWSKIDRNTAIATPIFLMEVPNEEIDPCETRRGRFGLPLPRGMVSHLRNANIGPGG
jgi:hypothetical protein